MSGLIKVIVVFVICVISFISSVIAYKNDEYSPFACIFGVIGGISFCVGLIAFMLL